MNLPNLLTLFRIALTFIFMIFLYLPGANAKLIASLIFCLASITDFFDGYLARKYSMITDLGKLLDPIADKVLVLSAFLAFVEMGIVYAWMIVIIIARELLLTGLRILAANKGIVLSAARAGKHKTVSQMISILVILIYLVLKEAGMLGVTVGQWMEEGIFVLMLVTVALTVISGVSFIKGNQKILRGSYRS